MGHRDVQLHGRQGRRHRRIDVADHQHDVGLALDEQLLDRHQDLGRLFTVGARADPQIHVRFGDLEVSEERLAHRLVVVLTRVDEDRLETVASFGELLHQGRDLHEVRPRARDGEQADSAMGDVQRSQGGHSGFSVGGCV